MSKPTETVLLRNLDSHGHSKPFAADHAERLLAYPGTRWAKIEEADPIAKGEAAAAKKKPVAAAAALPEADATGHPQAI